MFNEIEKCFEELAVISYKLGLIPGDKLWEDLMLSPAADFWDLMSGVKMFARIEDDVWQEKRATGSNSRGETLFKKWKESWADYECWVRQGINMIFKEPIYKLFTWILDNPYFKKTNPMIGDPKKRNQRWMCSFHEEKGYRPENCWALNFFLY